MEVSSVETLAKIRTQHDSKCGKNPDLMVAIVNSMMVLLCSTVCDMCLKPAYKQKRSEKI